MKNRNGATIKYPKIYHAWYTMIRRCYNPKSSNFERYGALGIKVCSEWLNNFESFLEWALKTNHAKNLSLDRIDSKKDYSPDNCRWSDYYTQNQNKSSRKSITKVRGVYPYKNDGRYRAEIAYFGKRIFLGIFNTLEEAARVRKAKELELSIAQ
jgi:hypothetical protein